MTRSRREDKIIQAVACPICHAPVGQPCRARTGRPDSIDQGRPFVHRERRTAWQAAKVRMTFPRARVQGPHVVYEVCFSSAGEYYGTIHIPADDAGDATTVTVTINR